MLFLVIVADLFIATTFTSATYLTEQPSFLPPCQIKDPEFTKCSTRSVQSLFSEIADKGGLPGVDSVPPIDPLKINKIKVTQSGNDAINIKLDLSNVLVEGFGKLKIVESRVSPKDYSWNTKLYLPKMLIRGNYVLKGRILLINMNGHGKMSLQIENPNIVLGTKTRLYEKGGLTFYNVTSTDCDYTISRMTTYFANLFNGNKALEESTNAFFNENWETLNEALKPVLQKTIGDVFLNYMQTLFHAVPAEFLITDIPSPKELYGE